MIVFSGKPFAFWFIEDFNRIKSISDNFSVRVETYDCFDWQTKLTATIDPPNSVFIVIYRYSYHDLTFSKYLRRLLSAVICAAQKTIVKIYPQHVIVANSFDVNFDNLSEKLFLFLFHPFP